MNNSLVDNFLAIYKHGSINKASTETFMTPAAVLRKLNDLEKEVNAVLFIRDKSGCTLTEQGKIFLEFSYSYKRHYESLLTDLSHSSISMRNLTIGFDNQLGQYFVNDICTICTEKYTGAGITLQEMPNSAFYTCLLNRSIDLCYSMKPYNLLKTIEYSELFSKNVCIAVLKTSPLANRKEIFTCELKDYTICLTPLYNSISHKKITDSFSRGQLLSCSYEEFLSIREPSYVFLTSGLIYFNLSDYLLIPLSDLLASYGVLYLAKERGNLHFLIEESRMYFQRLLKEKNKPF